MKEIVNLLLLEYNATGEDGHVDTDGTCSGGDCFDGSSHDDVDVLSGLSALNALIQG